MAQILDESGRVVPSAHINRVRVRALVGPGMGSTPWEAAEWGNTEMGQWSPSLQSPDVESSPYRDRIVARIRDIVRNDGWASGGVTRIVDSVVGANLRPVPKPDWQFLSRRFGTGFDATWADEFGQAATAGWRNYSTDMGRYCDAGRRNTMGQMFAIAFRHTLIDGECLGALPWLADRQGPGRADYATALQLIDPDRLSNPQGTFDQRFMRRGVEIDGYGAAVAYHIRRAHQGDYFRAGDSYIWDRIPRETPYGRPCIVHHFDGDRADTHNGSGGVFAPILARMKMLAKYDAVELQAAVINAIFSAYVQSPYDPSGMADALGAGDATPSDAYHTRQLETHMDTPVTLNGARLPIFYPGEEIKTVTAARPSSHFADFQSACLRNLASGLGISYEQLSQDWSKTNYSSARAALLEAWKTMSRRRDDFTAGFAQPIYGAWLEEAMDNGEMPLPAGAPEYMAARTAYARARWMGPPRGWVDPVKEAEAAILRINNNLSTLEDECAEQGNDMEDTLAQRAIEVKRLKELGLVVEMPANPTALTKQTPAETQTETEQGAQ
jgi:lambda family phage portal protein